MLDNIFTDHFFYIGAVIAFLLAGYGSSRGVGLAGQTGAGVLTEDPSKFGSVMVLQALPSTQAIYGFVIAFMIVGKVDSAMTVQEGLRLLCAGLPAGIMAGFGHLRARFRHQAYS